MSAGFAVRKTLSLSVLALLLSACYTIDMQMEFERDSAIESRILTLQSDQFPEIDLLAMSQEMKDYLAEHIDPDARMQLKVEVLRELLFNEEHLNIQYEDGANLTAIEVFQQRQANCLALVNLFIAMARHVGIDANYHTVQIRPRWDRRGELLIISEHINATGRLAHATRYVVDFTPELSLQQLTAQVITDQEARALYFNNLGVDRLITQEYDQALMYFRNALLTDPNLAIGWNNLGAAFNRLRDTELAEYSYQVAFDLDNSNATPINNLAKLYLTRGDLEKSELYTRTIQHFNNRNPYYHFMLGNAAYSSNNFDQARRHYQTALRRKDTEPDFYFALGQSYRQLGMEVQAQRALDMAVVLLEQGDQLYRPSQDRLRVINEDTIFRPSSAGFSISPSGR